MVDADGAAFFVSGEQAGVIEIENVAVETNVIVGNSNNVLDTFKVCGVEVPRGDDIPGEQAIGTAKGQGGISNLIADGISDVLRTEVSTPVEFEGGGDGISVVPERGAVEFAAAASVPGDVRLGVGEMEDAAVEKRDILKFGARSLAKPAKNSRPLKSGERWFRFWSHCYLYAWRRVGLERIR